MQTLMQLPLSLPLPLPLNFIQMQIPNTLSVPSRDNAKI